MAVPNRLIAPILLRSRSHQNFLKPPTAESQKLPLMMMAPTSEDEEEAEQEEDVWMKLDARSTYLTFIYGVCVL